mgnify:CR=1 FL=1
MAITRYRSARANSAGGTLIPSAFAAGMLIVRLMLRRLLDGNGARVAALQDLVGENGKRAEVLR